MITLSRAIVTGGFGFIGSCLIDRLLSVHDFNRVLSMDIVTTASAFGMRHEHIRQRYCQEPYDKFNPDDLENPEKAYCSYWASVNHGEDFRKLLERFQPDVIYHLAAETHVDTSLSSSSVAFSKTNVQGTHTLLQCLAEFSQRHGHSPRFVYVSTDEVYGDWSLAHEQPAGFRESDTLKPRNPYSATKAAAELLCNVYAQTYKLPIVITRGCNTFGPWQSPEKFIPKIAQTALAGKPVPIYGSGDQIREWLPVEDHADGIYAASAVDEPDVFNIGSGVRYTNMQTKDFIIQGLNCDARLYEHVPDRLNHDIEYRIDCSKLVATTSWRPSSRDTVRSRMTDTALWYGSAEGRTWLASFV